MENKSTLATTLEISYLHVPNEVLILSGPLVLAFKDNTFYVHQLNLNTEH